MKAVSDLMKKCSCQKIILNFVLLVYVVFLTMPLLIFGDSPGELKTDTQRISRLASAITRGIDFLYKSQLSYGEFRTCASADRDNSHRCYFDSSPFVTSFVVYSLNFSNDPRVQEIKKKALRFFTSEMEYPGVWRYWTSRNHKSIDPDLDDIALFLICWKKIMLM